MKTSRLEAFSDGVLAIIITIMVLELKAPDETDFNSLIAKTPVFLSYVFSFIYVGIYWNNHHHLFQITQKVNGKILWANLHLLFWLSLIPFTSAWIGKNFNEKLPVIAYGVILLFCAIAYFILQSEIIKSHNDEFALRKAIGSDTKGKISIVFYILGIGFAFLNTWIAIAFYGIVAIMWLIPDRRIEKSV
ncbi:TMEM175 family protein [Flavobacterium sp.]|uniref:TMEM175 family protein n=1 Tax=Flavobacterium sp. TaxID=239 RepID=UPI0026043942|nr:TMEM175 family protein [Flavobacterium sp.]MDD2985085.1 TMEM175 family protein [Flavobacterium sp.]